MALLLEENWNLNQSGSAYPIGDFNINIPSYNGGYGWYTEADPVSAWSWNNDADPLPAVDATSQTYGGLVTAGNKLLFYSRSDGQHWQYLTRDIAESSWIPWTEGKIYWLAFTSSCYTNKADVTLKLDGVTSDQTNNATVYFHSFTDLRPERQISRAFDFSTTLLYEGDASFSTHLIVYKMTCDSAYGIHFITCLSYVDPDLNKNPKDWQGTGSGTLYMDYIKGWYLNSGRNGSTIDSRNYFDSFRIADTWWEAVGKSSDPTSNAWPLYFWNKF